MVRIWRAPCWGYRKRGFESLAPSGTKLNFTGLHGVVSCFLTRRYRSPRDELSMVSPEGSEGWEPTAKAPRAPRAPRKTGQGFAGMTA